MRGNGVPVAVAGQEHDFTAAESAESQRAGGLAVGRAHHLTPRDLKIGELGKAGAADDAEHDCGTQDFNA